MNRKSETHSSVLHTLRAPAWSVAQDFDPITGHRVVPLNPRICFADGEGDGDGDPAPEKTFTQADVDRMMKSRMKKADAENAKLARKLESQTEQISDLTSKFEGLQEKYDATNKSDVEKELAKIQRAAAKMESERDQALKLAAEATNEAAAAVAGLTQTKLKSTLREGLRKSKAHGQGMDQAVDLMLGNGASFDDDGNFQMTVDDVPYDNPAEAAAKWLEKNSHFREGVAGGAGTPRGGNNRVLNNESMGKMNPTQLISAGLSTPVK